MNGKKYGISILGRIVPFFHIGVKKLIADTTSHFILLESPKLSMFYGFPYILTFNTKENGIGDRRKLLTN